MSAYVNPNSSNVINYFSIFGASPTSLTSPNHPEEFSPPFRVCSAERFNLPPAQKVLSASSLSRDAVVKVQKGIPTKLKVMLRGLRGIAFNSQSMGSETLIATDDSCLNLGV